MESPSGTTAIVTPKEHLPIRIRPAVWVGDEALLEFCRLNRDLRIERTKDGELIIMPPAGSASGKRNFALTGLFFRWVAKDGTGVGFDSSTGFILPNGAERSPDAAWIKNERWDALTPKEQERFAPLCPDLVVELRSPTDRLADLKAKMQEYIDNGASLGWLIDPTTRTVHLYRPGVRPRRLKNAKSISGEPLLRGFTLDLTAIW
ncbi:MAG: Uma2 family endonuclease [Myxococcales bacterium]|nr:Uma2 family endonuclease [Myxococcales bacterium]